MGSAAAWATATGVCVSQVSLSVNKGFGLLLPAAIMTALWASRAKFCQSQLEAWRLLFHVATGIKKHYHADGGRTSAQ